MNSLAAAAPTLRSSIAKTLIVRVMPPVFAAIKSLIFTSREGFTFWPAISTWPFRQAAVARLRVLKILTAQSHLSIRMVLGCFACFSVESSNNPDRPVAGIYKRLARNFGTPIVLTNYCAPIDSPFSTCDCLLRPFCPRTARLCAGHPERNSLFYFEPDGARRIRRTLQCRPVGGRFVGLVVWFGHPLQISCGHFS